MQSAEKSSLLTLEGDYRLTQGAVTASALAPHQSKLNMGLFNAIDEFFTGPAAEVEMMSASEQREQAQRLNELQDEEETFGLTEKSSANIRQLSSSSNSSRGNDSNDSGGSVKLLLALIGGFVAIYLTYEYGVGNGVKVSSSDGGINHPAILPTDTSTNLDAVPTTFTKEILHDTRQAATEFIDLLHNYYGGENKAKAMLVESWQAHWNLEKDAILSYNDGVDDRNNDDNDDDDSVNNPGERSLGKKKGVKKAKNILNNPDNMTPEELSQHHHHKKERTTKLVTTMARALLNPEQTKFTIGTIGSSVAAGHDNCHYDSYESQLERTLTPIFAAAKMDLQVQNAGEGGGCGDSHKNQVFCVAQNLSPDVDIIHYSWTYFEKGGAEEQREQLVRWAQHMPRRPMVHHLVARGKANTCEADSAENVALDRTYALYGYNAFCIQTGLYFGGHDYDTEIANDQNRFGWQNHGDGYHNTTRYGEALPDDDPRKESLGVVYRNWHPGPLGFQIASDAFAYVYISGLLLALDIIEEDMDSGANVFERWFDTSAGRRVLDVEEEDRQAGQRQLLQLPRLEKMPDPHFCHPLYCNTPHPPSCLNYELPTFGPAGIPVDSVTDDWSLWHEPNKWNYMVGKVDIAIFKKKNDPEWFEKCTHLDACGGMTTSGKGTGKIVYDLPVEQMTAGLVVICVCCGKKISESMVLNNDNMVFKLNDRVLDKKDMDLYPVDKCVRLLKGFEEDGYEKEEKMLLSVEVLGGETEVKISHVIVL